MTLRKELIDELLKASEGQDLFGKDGLLSELTGRLVERALEAELTEHLGYEKHSPAASQHLNSRNGHTAKTLRGKTGTVRVKVPRDREGSFEPQLVPKHARSLPGFDERVIALYGRGLSTREITEHLEELYHTKVSRDLISRVTDAVMEDAEAKWAKYVHLTEPWKKAWDRVIPFFDFPPRIRRIIYTTNAIEGLNRSLRRVLKTRGAFPNEKAVGKVLYLAIRRKSASWQRQCVNHWRETAGHFHILFGDRIPDNV